MICKYNTTMKYDAIQNKTMQCYAIQWNAIQRTAKRLDVMKYNEMQCSAAQSR